VLSTNATLTGLGLVIVLAIACRLVAERFRIPVIVLLLPVGFLAGAATEDVHPEALFGGAFQPLVSLGVGLILFEAGLRLSLDELGAGVRQVVLRLISIGTLLTLVSVAVATKLIFGLGWGVSSVLGAILVVSGPTVVLPLLSFVRPTDKVRSVLKWEGTLIDPIGALLGVLALHAVLQGAAGDRPFHPGALLSSMLIGVGVGLAGAAALWLILRASERSSPGQGVAAALMVLAAAVVGADLLREDSGLVAAAVMGMVLANQKEVDVSKILEFHGTIVGLLIGILFVLLSASVTPSQFQSVLGSGLALVAIMVFVIRPAVVAIGTWRSSLSWRERAFAAWMAPRGIVAAATASAFGLSLTQAGVGGADQILPIAFVVIFATVVLYGLTATAVAKLLGVAGAATPVVLIVGGQSWARDMALALGSSGVRVRLWTGRRDEQEAARAAGLDAGPPPLGVDVERLESELEEVSDALVMTDSDDFNALAAYELRQELGRDRVYRLAARAIAAPAPAGASEGRILFTDELTFPALNGRIEGGAEIVKLPDDGPPGAPVEGRPTPLFVISSDGRLQVATTGRTMESAAEDSFICLTGARPAVLS
jgi:NhaP-type Na+/H+ or K+/H+ antiporter